MYIASVLFKCCICFTYMFQMFHLFQIYVAFKCFMLQIFYILEVCLESHGDVTIL
jgi:hypothetical protein